MMDRVAGKLKPAAESLGVTAAQWQKAQKKAMELKRLCDLRFDSAAFGLGEVAKCVILFDLACTTMGVHLPRRVTVKLSSLSDRAYANSMATIKNAMGIRVTLDARQLAVQFGCARVSSSIKAALVEYKKTYREELPEIRRSAADFDRPVFTAAALFLVARKHKLKVERAKLLEVAGATEDEFQQVTASMQELCPHLFGVKVERKAQQQQQQQQQQTSGMGDDAEASGEEYLDSAHGDLEDSKGRSDVSGAQEERVIQEAVEEEEAEDKEAQELDEECEGAGAEDEVVRGGREEREQHTKRRRLGPADGDRLVTPSGAAQQQQLQGHERDLAAPWLQRGGEKEGEEEEERVDRQTRGSPVEQQATTDENHQRTVSEARRDGRDPSAPASVTGGGGGGPLARPLKQSKLAFARKLASSLP